MPSEIQIQAKAFQTVYNEMPQTRGLIFHVPNGGSRNVLEGMQLKASGVIAGVPDIIFLWMGKAYGFEFKTDIGSVSPIQVKIHKVWELQGIPVHVIREPETFINIIKSIVYQKPIAILIPN
nr:VRR-NUC domain-containing protein [Pseudopedobacter sp.]